ncbi:MAG TPA: hypothetical protein VND91_12470, partial [Candidatus Saccharimonadia bacterium]|nr:hypothetical protein [Candidatus Saccharimonadia bacterium]
MNPVELRIEQWRVALRRQGVHSFDVEDLEDRLRAQAASLRTAGLSEEEAFLVAAKRIGDLDRHTRTLANEGSERVWNQLETAAP